MNGQRGVNLYTFKLELLKKRYLVTKIQLGINQAITINYSGHFVHERSGTVLSNMTIQSFLILQQITKMEFTPFLI